MKHVIILGDGMADRPIAQLGNRTPLQAAYKPNMDRLAREGCCGMFRTIEDDVPTGSEAANLVVMGYDPRRVLQGRGVLEAASMGIELHNNEIALRCNLINIDPEGRILNHSAGHISSPEAELLIHFLQTEIGSESLHFYPGVSYRHVLIARDLDPRLICAPPHDHPGEPVDTLAIRPAVPEAAETASALNALTRRSRELLPSHPVNRRREEADQPPANSIWLWSPGRKPEMWTYRERFGISGAVISAVDLIRGIGIYAGLEVYDVPGATGLWNTNYEGKAAACLRALEKHDFCYVHLEAPDEAGHEGDLELKIQTIADLDARLIGPILRGIEAHGWEAVVAVLPDHPTPVEERVHVRDEVPFAIRHPRRSPDGVLTYDELACRSGSFGTLHGDAFIRAVLAGD